MLVVLISINKKRLVNTVTNVMLIVNINAFININ